MSDDIVRKSLEQRVRARARGTCEYCRMPEALHPAPYQVDHIIARQHRGRTVLSNLALACLRCNSHKGPNIAGIDPESQQIVRLFHPRNDDWNEHFEWDGPWLRGRTPAGRATIEVLAMNDPVTVRLRRSLIEEGRFPPD